MRYIDSFMIDITDYNAIYKLFNFRFGELLCHSIWDSARTIFFESCFNEIVLRGEAQELIK